jgi:polyphosphate kinase
LSTTHRYKGRDAAGKGGAIKRFMEHLKAGGARLVALEKSSDAERGQWYFQRYIQHLPSKGEIVLSAEKSNAGASMSATHIP